MPAAINEDDFISLLRRCGRCDKYLVPVVQRRTKRKNKQPAGLFLVASRKPFCSECEREVGRVSPPYLDIDRQTRNIRPTIALGERDGDGDNPWGDYATRQLEDFIEEP